MLVIGLKSCDLIIVIGLKSCDLMNWHVFLGRKTEVAQQGQL